MGRMARPAIMPSQPKPYTAESLLNNLAEMVSETFQEQ